MRIVVSGTHASGKSTLVSDVALVLRGYSQLPDPVELVENDEWDEPAGATSFVRQLAVAAERLVALPPGSDVVVERGPVDFLAYLEALTDLRRASAGPDLMRRLRATTAEAMAHVDLLVVLPLDARDGIRVPDEEDPELRAVTDEHLVELCEDVELVGGTGRVLEVTGAPDARVARVLAAVEALGGPSPYG